MRKVEKIEGTSFTKRKTETLVAETPDEIEAAFKSHIERSKHPWERHKPYLDACVERLKELREQLPDGAAFEPHVDTGWYFEQLIMLDGMVRSHIADGNAEWAAQEAALYGETWCELQFHLAREAPFLKSAETKSRQSDAGSRRRKHPSSDEERMKYWAEQFAVHGKSGESDESTAERFGVTAGRIRQIRRAGKIGVEGSD